MQPLRHIVGIVWRAIMLVQILHGAQKYRVHGHLEHREKHLAHKIRHHYGDQQGQPIVMQIGRKILFGSIIYVEILGKKVKRQHANANGDEQAAQKEHKVSDAI